MPTVELAPGSCSLSTRGVRADGYSRFRVGGSKRYAHVVAWERENGPVPAGMTLDHECHNEAAARGECAGGPDCLHRRCVNPDHLAAKPIGANAAASPLSNASRTRCVKGHEFTPENTDERYGQRVRVTCRRARQREYQQRRRDRTRA